MFFLLLKRRERKGWESSDLGKKKQNKNNKKNPKKTKPKKQPCANIYVALYYGAADRLFQLEKVPPASVAARICPCIWNFKWVPSDADLRCPCLWPLGGFSFQNKTAKVGRIRTETEFWCRRTESVLTWQAACACWIHFPAALWDARTVRRASAVLPMGSSAPGFAACVL